MANKYHKYKIHGKNGRKKSQPQVPAASQNSSSDVNVGPQEGVEVQLTTADKEVMEKIDELHVFLTQRGCPYLVIAQTPDTKHPAGKFSFNHEHNKPQQTYQNAEWVFRHLGGMLARGTGGVVELVRHY